MLGARIASLRRRAGMSQAQLAQKLGISASAVGMYEQGRREPAVDLLVAMGAVFGVSVDYLLTGSGEVQSAAPVQLNTIASLERQLSRRRSRPFSREELTVLYTALLLDT